jgi:hypothetical protein
MIKSSRFFRHSRAMSQSVGRRPSITEGCVRYQASLCGIYGTQSDTGTGCTPHVVFSRQYHPTNDFYSCFIYQPSPLYSWRCLCLKLESTLNARVKWLLHRTLLYEQFIVSLHNALPSVSRILVRYSCFIFGRKRIIISARRTAILAYDCHALARCLSTDLASAAVAKTR